MANSEDGCPWADSVRRLKTSLRQFAQDQLLFFWYRGGKNWKGCRAFAIPNNDSVGAIRVSVKGRDRDGVVEPVDYQAVCHDIADALYELRDKRRWPASHQAR